MKFVIFTLTAVLLTPLAFSQNTPPAATDGIIVTASALPETVDAVPAAVTVITREDIDRQGARDVADVLREVPGFNISRTGTNGKATSVFTRGSSSTHTLVLWNGVEINNPYFAGYDWGRFSTAGIQQIEIVRGPYSALYGSDAMAGVVNIITAPFKSEFRGALELGGHGLRNGNLEGSWVTHTQMFRGTYEHRQDDGFADNDDFKQESADLFWRWTASNHFSLGATARHTSYKIGIPTNLNAAGTEIVPSPNRRGKGDETQISIPIQQTIGTFSYDLTLADSRRNDEFHDPDDPYFLIDSATDSTARRARLTSRLQSGIGTLIFGGEYERATVNDNTSYGPNLDHARRTEKSLFVEDRLSREVGNEASLELSAGVRYDKYDTFGSQTSPRVAIAWINHGTKLRAAIGDAFRAPSTGELYFPFSGNVNLRPERNRSWEAGYDQKLPNGSVSMTYFSNRFRDLITFDNRTFVFGNVASARTSGVEVAMKRDLTTNLYSSATYTYLRRHEDGNGKPLARRPAHSGSLFLGYRSGDLDTSLVLIHTGVRDDVQPVYPFGTVTDEAWTTVDLNMQLRMGSITPFAKVENITDKKYEDVRGYPSPGRRAVVGIRFSM